MKLRRVLPWCLLVGGIGLAAGLGWYGWRWYCAPVAPVIDLTEDDSALVAAVEQARQQIRQDPYSGAAWGHLGKLLRAAGYVEPAVRCLAEAERLDPRNPRWPYLQGDALARRDPDAALPHLRRAVDLCGDRDAETVAPRLRLAEVLLAKGEGDEAEVQLQRALEAEPDNPSVSLYLGILAFDRATEGESAQKLLEASRKHFLRCRHSPWTQQRACAQLAAVCQRLGDTKAAAEFSQKAGTLPRDLHWPDPFVMEYLQLDVGRASRFRIIERLEAQGRFADAVFQLREMVEQNPDYKTYVGLGKDLAQVGNVAEAEQALRSAIQLAPENAQAYYLLARVQWSRAQQEREQAKAQEAFAAAAANARQVLQRRPDHALAHLVLGMAVKALGKREEAMASLQRAVQCAPELSDPHLYLGEMLLEDGQTDEARKHLEQAVQLARPDDPRPRAALERLRAAAKKRD
jgi:tetratricopeptide (TPR) repeat protein